MSKEMEAMLVKEGLNRAQRKFCKIPSNKNIRLLAPAGSGKTYSILWRCKTLIEENLQKDKPEPRFLIVTFTRAAKLELEERIANIPDFSCLKGLVTISTLNAWGWKRISAGKELIATSQGQRGLVTHDLLPLCQKYPMLWDAMKGTRNKSTNSTTIIETIDLLKLLGFTHLMNKREYNSHIRYLKELGLMPMLNAAYQKICKMEGKEESEEIKSAAINEFWMFWKKAVVHLESVSRFTMEDQKYWPRIYLETSINEQHFPQGGGRYSHIIVDEFQDINPLDLSLIKAISEYHGHGKPVNLTIVGDDDQAIFGWRGTTPKFILEPEKYFGVKFETCILETNYRSPKDIVEPACKLISRNRQRIEKEMKSAAKGRAYLKVVSRKRLAASMEAVMTTVRKILENANGGTVALVGRKQTALFPYQVMLSAEGIRYRIDADIDIFEGEAMQILQNIMRIIYRAKIDDNDNPVEEMLQVCDCVYRYKIPKKDRDALHRYLLNARVSSFREAAEALKSYPELIKGQSASSMVFAVETLVKAETVYDFMKAVEENFRGFDKDYTKKERDNHYKEPQFFRLTELARKYGSDFRRFSRDIELAKQMGENSRKMDDGFDSEDAMPDNSVRVHLLTATRSKGREFDNVIILDVHDGEWPSALSDDIEEERRLFYVAMTRARHHLYFVVSEDNMSSRFLLEAVIQ